jgi:hypothetical protein
MGRNGLKRVVALPLEPAELADLAYVAWVRGEGSWSFGVQGAVADFAFDGDPTTVARHGDEIEVTTPRGAMRLSFAGSTGFAAGEAVIVARSPGPAVAPPPGLALARPDHDAVDPAHRHATLVELGLGRLAVRFCFRTEDPYLLEAARALTGCRLADVLARLGPLLAERSPHRVVITALGRCEVFTPIPRPGGASPDGPHTHLLPDALATGLDLPAGLVLPEGFVAGVTFHPGRGGGSG